MGHVFYPMSHGIHGTQNGQGALTISEDNVMPPTSTPISPDQHFPNLPGSRESLEGLIILSGA